MKLREVFRYELGYRFRSRSTWAYAGCLFLVAMWMFLATADDGALFNPPERVAGGSVLPAMFGLLVSAALFGDAAVRDVRSGMDALVYASPVGKTAYLGGRFLGALAVNAVVLVAVPLGVLAATALAPRAGEEVGPIGLAANVQPYGLFLLPNLVLAGALLFALGVLTRHVLPVYLAAIGVFIGYVVALNYAGGIGSPALAALADPLGLVTLQRVTRYWTEAERDVRLVGLPAELLWNRAFWLAVAGTVLALLHVRFRFAHPDGGDRGRRRVSGARAPSEHTRPVDVPRVAGRFGARTAVRQTLAVARNALAEVAASRWFVVVLLACVGLPLLWGWNVGDTVFDTSTWPVTLLVIETVLPERSAALFVVLIVVFAGELAWKQREVGVAEIADAAPVPDGVLVLGRFLALVALIASFQAASIVGGVLIQALQGYHRYELDLYLRAILGLKLVDYVLLGALATAIHVVVDHKHVGHLCVVMTLGALKLAGPLLGIRHHLLLYNTAPDWTYSDMNGFGPFAAPFAWFKAYWAAWALLLGVLTVLFLVRGREPGLRRRLRRARARFTGGVVPVAGAGIALVLSVGGFVLYNTNVLNEYRRESERGARQAAYEERYSRYADLPQPTIVAAELRVELFPDEPAAELRGEFQLVNRTAEPIDAVHVYLAPGVEVRALALDVGAEAVVVDEEVGYRIVALERALGPGDSARLAFDVALRPRGFPNDGIQTDVVANGTTLDRRRMPFIGYQPAVELSDPETRARFGLPPRAPVPGPDDAEARGLRWATRDAELVQVDAIVGTAADQIAVTPGVLVRSWTEGARRWFHYRTEEPIPFGGTIWSARYAVVEDRWNDVALRVLHHPAHAENLDRMVRGMKAALEYLTATFGAYPYGELAIVEVPRYGGFGRAHPYAITFTEDVFFSRVREGEVDQPFYATAHEVAHAWWGGMVRGASVRGAQFLSESLANYSAMVVIERTYGRAAARRVHDFHMERYRLGRATQSREVPVLEVEDQPYIAYRRGAVALYALRERIGAERVDGALRRYFEAYRAGVPPFPTSRDLYAELRAVTPDALHGWLADLLETVTLWDVETRAAHVEPTDAGEYRVTLDVAARKVRADEVGTETEVPMDELVEVGVFAEGDDGELGEALYLERHRVASGTQTITVTVPRRPARAGVDPQRWLIERDGEDNVVDVGG